MSKELAITLEDKPGTLAKLTEALGAAGVNIETFFVAPGPKSNCRILVDDPVAARKAIEGAGLKVDSEREALAVELDDQAGSLGRIARKLANAQVNIENAYVAGGGNGKKKKIVIITADAEKAKGLL